MSFEEQTVMEAIEENGEISTHEAKPSVLKYSNVSLSQKGLKVLNGVNLEICKGDFLYLIGKTGSGKSTFLKSVYGEIPITEGSAEVAKVQLRDLKRKHLPDLRRKLGMIFQDFRLLEDRTVFDNMSFVLRATGWKDKREIENKVESSLNEVGLKYKGDSFPYELSGGERQRLAIARALLNGPELIIADEPTGNLDPETSNDIMNLIKRLQDSHDAAVLLATHDYRLLAEFPGKIVRCENGTLITY